jgi:predicted nucleic acid-binding protein
VSTLLLDTNIPSESTRGSPDPKVDAWIPERDDETLRLTVVTIGELRKGLDLAPQGKPSRSELEEWLEKDLTPTFEGRILPVTKAIAEKWIALSADGSSRADPSAWPMV